MLSPIACSQATPATPGEMLDKTTPATPEEILNQASNVMQAKYECSMVQVDSSGNSGDTTVARVLVKANKMRVGITRPEQKVEEYLIDRDTRKMYLWYAPENKPQEIKNAWEVADFTSATIWAKVFTTSTSQVIGTETIDNKECLVVEYGQGNSPIKAWVWKEKPFVIQVEIGSNDGKAAFKFLNIEFGDIPDSAFELPGPVVPIDTGTAPATTSLAATTTKTNLPPATTSTLPPKPTPPTATIPISTWTYWGPAGFGSDYPATPRTMITFTDMKPTTSPQGKPGINVRPVAVGLSSDRSYYLWSRKLGQNVPTQLSPLEMNVTSDGSLVSKGSMAPITLTFDSFAKGEARVLALMTEDKSTITYGKLVMFPIQDKEGNSRVWAELLSPNGELFAVYGDGFEPNEELNAKSNSEGEVINTAFKADGLGRFTSAVLPAVKGKQSGTVIYTVVGKASTLELAFEWGLPALQPGPQRTR